MAKNITYYYKGNKCSDYRVTGKSDPYYAQSELLGELLKTDPDRAFKELSELAQKSAYFMLRLGWAYDKGLGTKINTGQAELWYRRAAEQNSRDGYYYLGDHYVGCRDYEKALEAFEAGAALGDERSQAALRDFGAYLRWHVTSARWHEAYNLLKTDPVRGHEAFRQLAERGDHAGSMLTFGWTYETGCGTAVDPGMAEHWYRRVFDGGDDWGKTQAAYHLGDIYHARGDYAMALEYLRYACNHGHEKATRELGWMYARGHGVEKDVKMARSFFQQATHMGDLGAPIALALQDLSGSFGLINFVLAIPRFLRAMWVSNASLEKVGNTRVSKVKEE